MNRRRFLQSTLGAGVTAPMLAALKQSNLDEAAAILDRAARSGQVTSAVLHVTQREASFTRCFGNAKDENAMFLLGSISKPICMAALMTLFDRGEFKLSDPLKRFLPQFTGGERDKVTIQHILTHTSGLADQLPENNELRRKHADLTEFAEHATRAPIHFSPGSKYEYSSMGILLASRVAELISGSDIRTLVDRAVFQPLKMEHSAQGLGRFKLQDMIPVQIEHAAPEAGGGDPSAKDWDWNSPYWRNLGAPWGGTHCSAPDIAKFLAEFRDQRGACVKPATAKLMITNQNPPGVTPRGLGLNVGHGAGPKGCSDRTFGHTGSTGTIAWCDPANETTCVVLTSLPAQAVTPHPRDLASAAILSVG